MAKTDKTFELERAIYSATSKKGLFGCFEVTIGFSGNERVDYITYDTKGVWRCYEIKVSKADFHSKAKKTFVGHFNYFVMTRELYNEVKDEVPNNIGVYIGGSCHKKAKRQELGVDEQVLKNSMIRSLFREFDKQYRSGNPYEIERLNRRVNVAESEAKEYRRRYQQLMNIGYEKYGSRWYKEEKQ